MLIEDSETWKRIIREGEGYIYNDFGTQFPGDAPTWNTRDFSKLHRVSCTHVKKMTYITEGKLTKYFFKSEEEAIGWLEKNRKKEGYTRCPCTRIIPDLLNTDNEYLFKLLGRERKYSLELKCLVLVLILYVPGLITTFFAGNLNSYAIGAWRHLVRTVLIGVVVWLIIRFVKRMDKKIHHVSQIISPMERKEGEKGYDEWENWKGKINEYKNWLRRLDSYRRYYVSGIIGALGGFIIGVLVIKPDVGWVNNNIFSEWYLRLWYTFLGFLLGTSMHIIRAGFWVIRKYCKDVISDKVILPLDPDHTGGLRELGRLSLDLDLIVALPSVAFPLYLLANPEIELFKENIPTWAVISVLYSLVLVFIFFVSISPAHDNMVNAKTAYLLKIHREYKDMHEGILKKLKPDKLMEPKEYDRLKGLYDLYDRVEKMAVWPLDFRTTLRFAITTTLPLITIGITISV